MKAETFSLTNDAILVFTVTIGMSRAEGEGAGVGSLQKVLGMPSPEGVASGTARTRRQAAQAAPQSAVQPWELRVSVIPGDSRTSPAEGWWVQHPPFSNPEGFCSRPGIPVPGAGAWPCGACLCPGAFRRSQLRDWGSALPTLHKVSAA